MLGGLTLYESRRYLMALRAKHARSAKESVNGAPRKSQVLRAEDGGGGKHTGGLHTISKKWHHHRLRGDGTAPS